MSIENRYHKDLPYSNNWLMLELEPLLKRFCLQFGLLLLSVAKRKNPKGINVDSLDLNNLGQLQWFNDNSIQNIAYIFDHHFVGTIADLMELKWWE